MRFPIFSFRFFSFLIRVRSFLALVFFLVCRVGWAFTRIIIEKNGALGVECWDGTIIDQQNIAIIELAWVGKRY